ncbi:hypothetical protein [Sphingomonas sp.]|uniref:hypothetical protein n=1 Tax=Sphingomonas sp. TaxID=28214 RepID=UPI000DB68858|nr:hypothetical protein [Sphingomonas sp.]PZU08567.1 MAG: hypothetical protein DI605_11425 [Sphingomonas sp.]
MDLLRFAPFFIAYAVAALLSIRATDRAPSPGARRLWRTVAFLLALLLIEKALEQTMLFEITRLAISEGWYPYRRQIQAALVVALFVLGLATVASLWRTRAVGGGDARRALALALALLAFASIRAVSLHVIDSILALRLGPVLLRHVVELLLVGSICLLALRTGRADER